MAKVAAARPGGAVPVAADGARRRAHWEHFDHDADIGVRGWGATKAEAFEQAALALTAVVTDPAGVMARETVPIFCDAADDELLLAAWLNAIVSAMSMRRMLFGRFHVEFEGHDLNATATGEHISVSRHRPAVEVKGATYTCSLIHI